ncbi:hypothetical protein [Cohnella sp. REN36]|uniref:hypothetical protein n=1 Tax=Cohnella sp. REN36 TaxID=2887347 RepID=UPI001D134D5F|nr:hypothetical protein [Cohnella sp. REN36]MCC3373719.1 hypothetical protein [Cohnella sp. REN36]
MRRNSLLSLMRFVALAAIVATVVAGWLPAGRASAATTGMAWSSGSVTAYAAPSGGVWYPRLLKLSNGDWLLSFDSNADGGRVKVKVVRSTDGGATWSSPVDAAADASGDCANGQMLQLADGSIWLAYRVVVQSGSTYSTYLKVRVSTNGGSAWSDLPGGQIAAETANSFKGVWEPHLGLIGSTIAVMYANDSPSVTGASGKQNLYMKTWTGSGWGSATLVSDGVAAGSRDGMPVWTRMGDGRYILVFEASDQNGYPFVIRYKISSDGYNWSGARQTLYMPAKTGKKAGAPFVVKLGDGRLMASFQTDEDSPNTGDAYSSMRTMISADNGASWGSKFNPYPVSDTTYANWNALLASDATQAVAATSTNFPSARIVLRFGNAGTPSNVNLSNNWGFETANVNGWTTYGDDYPNRILIHGANDGIARAPGGGNYFVGLAGTSGPGTAYVGQTITGLDSGTYTLRAYMRSSGGQNAAYMEVKDYGGVAQTANFPVTTTWTQVTIPGVAVTNGQATIGFYASMSGSSQWADLDNVEWIKTSSSTPLNTNLTNNGGFETANVNGWTTYGDDYPNRILIHGINDGIARAPGGGNYFVGLAGTSGPGTAYVGQTITGLQNGTYTMRAYLRSSGGQNAAYMEVKDYGGGALTANFPATTTWTQVTIPGVGVTGGRATIGFYASMNSSSQWADIDNVEWIRTS